MKRRTILSMLLGFIVVLGYIVYINVINWPLYLSDEEKNYMAAHQNTIFEVGYFPTDKEQRFSEKLCAQIEADTGLKLQLYEAPWQQTLGMLKEGTLPIVMNMNITPERLTYTHFTDSFAPIPCGIYSSETSPITTFSDLNGKVIGIEKGNALAEAFASDFPNIPYTLVAFDNVQKTREAFEEGIIDGFLTSKSFEENIGSLHYFEIESISKGTNHVGVSDQYPILYSILSKEVDYLKSKKWDMAVADLIGFEVERTQIVFSDEEQVFLTEHPSLHVGIPEEYFLYYTGETYNLRGILPTIIDKIAFISNTNVYYTVDSLKNLRLREDIDFYIDNIPSQTYQSTTAFENELIAIGSADKRAFREIYELASKRIGVLGVPNLFSQLKDEMPPIDVVVFESVSSAESALKNDRIDYLVLPKDYYDMSSLRRSFIERGDFFTKSNYFVSGQATCMDILNKCLAIIDVDKIIQEQNNDVGRVSTNLKIVFALSGVAILLFGIDRISKRIIKKLFFDNPYRMGNLKWLERKLRKTEGYLGLVEVADANRLRSHYGKKRYEKYMRNFAEGLRKALKSPDEVFYVTSSMYLVKAADPKSFEDIHEMARNKIYLADLMLPYNVAMSYVDYTAKDTVEILLSQLLSGIEAARTKKNVYYYSAKQQDIYKNRLAREEQIKRLIKSGDIAAKCVHVVDSDGILQWRYVVPNVEGMQYQTLLRYIEKMDLGTSLNTAMLKKLLNEDKREARAYLMEIFDETVESKGFLEWVSHLNKGRHALYFAVSMEAFLYVDANLEIPEFIHFVIKDFGRDLKKEVQLKYFPVSLLLLDTELEDDIGEDETLRQFISAFAQAHGKALIAKSSYCSVADYYIEEAVHESADC
ncbi:transporter substrate-binding domain-containing protein [Fusibacter paucivorans]|uniref:Transporter substrate-binding domain-containing protein n=1 Tax=Fusibacter paucivorans TaxID=76009 RepID=A0ABS5PKA6_9FIRM|nr:transporter substrate-binding domain-containing protein [Fusibacter paucivorans]MBS7525262.1 transporter substrate-binding domain-containing protein [Fusibacter paucivorans]